MERKIIAYKGYFREFFNSLDTGTQDKILYVLMLLQTQDRMPVKFMRLIDEGLYMNFVLNIKVIYIGYSFVLTMDVL